MTITVKASTYETFLKLKQLVLTEKEVNDITEKVGEVIQDREE